MYILGIESSCDDTSAAVILDTPNLAQRIRSNVVMTQITEHIEYGGVVPELAARAHLKHVKAVIKQALFNANLTLNEIDAIAVTAGPGLIGGVLVGLMVAKAIAVSCNKPLIGVNHLEGHALTIRLTQDIPYPYLLLLVSGGHCQFIDVQGLGQYKILGQTLDDACGEAFDKVAKMLDIGYPGGPALEKLALSGNPLKFPFNKPLVGRANCDLSFSGLKTAARLCIEKYSPLSLQDKADIAASFQKTVADHLQAKTLQAMKQVTTPCRRFVIAGGVAANSYIKKHLTDTCLQNNFEFFCPPIHLCTDNAAMIAWAGLERFKAGLTSKLTLSPLPRWSLESLDNVS